MNLYEVSTCDNDYDEYDSFAVFAESSEEAVEIVLDSFRNMDFYMKRQADQHWVAELIPVERGIVHSSFNAG